MTQSENAKVIPLRPRADAPAPAIATPPCPTCGHALTAAYDDGDSFWECDGCGRDVENRDLPEEHR